MSEDAQIQPTPSSFDILNRSTALCAHDLPTSSRDRTLPETYSEAAIKHFDDADDLAQRGRYDGAGYLVGYTVECAIKHAIEATRPTASAPHKHLPELIEAAKRALGGRRKHSMLTLLEKTNLMSGWKIDSRYAPAGSITKQQFEEWKLDASRALGAANIRRIR